MMLMQAHLTIYATTRQGLEIQASEPVIAALYRTLDRDRVGIHFADFKAFVLARDPELPLFRCVVPAKW